MKHSLKSLVALLVFFVTLLSWYLIYEKKVRVENQKQEEKSKHFVKLDKDAIQFLEILKEGETKPIQLQKSGEKWLLTSPLEDNADSSVVTSVLNSVTSATEERVVDEKPNSLTAYGLEKPEFRVSLKKNANDAAEVLLIGKETSVGFGVYVKLENSPTVYKSSKSIKTSLEKKPNDFRNKKLLDLKLADISEIDIQSKGQATILKKDEGGKWLIARENLPADGGEVNKTINALIGTSAQGFAAETDKEQAKFGLSNPTYSVTLFTTQEPKKHGLRVGSVKDKWYAKLDSKPVIYEINKTLADKLATDPKHYRKLDIAEFNRFELSRIKLDRKDNPLELVKEGANWSLPSEPTLKIDDNKVTTLLTKLQDTKLVGYEKNVEPSMGFKSPQLTLSLYEKKDDKETEVVKLEFGNQKWSNVFVKRADLSLPFTVKAGDFKELNPKKEDFIQKPSSPEPPKEKSE